jgi:hypothetical protein
MLCLVPGYSQEASQDYREFLYIQTDRDLYIVGEQVWMKIYKLERPGNEPNDFSRVVYIELLNQLGYPVFQIKQRISGTSGSFGMLLPDTLSSGNYLIRAYTSWMKNFPAKDFAFRTISLVNPSGDLQNIEVKAAAKADELKDIATAEKSGGSFFLELTFDETSYGTREGIKANIQAKDSSGEPVEADLSVTVCRTSLCNDHREIFRGMIRPSPGILPDTLVYLPELEDVLLSGAIFNSQSNEPMAKEDIILSIVGKAAQCQLYTTNEEGKFFFNLDQPGVQEIVIQPVDSTASDYYVELEPDFHMEYDHPLPAPLFLDTTKLRALNEGIINMQIEQIYKTQRPRNPDPGPETTEIDFYGEPEYSIQLSDYIQLNSLREAIKEIVPKVSLRESDGKSQLVMENGIDERKFRKKPLILVDGVPFDDVDQILRINIHDLERIEVLNLRYFLDGRLFEGIIHFITKAGNMAGLEFEHAIFRRAYSSFSEKHSFRSPIYSSDSEKNSPLADFRNTLYWDPDLCTGKEGKTSFTFYSSDDKGEYTVFVEGISPDGNLGSVTKKLIIH